MEEALFEEPRIEPVAYGALGRLADTLWDQEPRATADQALEAFMEWAEEQGTPLWPHQEDACMALYLDSHVVLGTPTGSGKSLVACALLFKALAVTGGTAYYTAPIKALVSEKFFQLVDLFGRDYVGMITGDSSINAGAPIICCTAEILANRALSEGEDADISCVAMDEFHFYGDIDRGWAWQVPLLCLPHTQFLLMSATLGDMTQVVELLERQTDFPVEPVLDAPRPVPLEFEYVETPLEGTVELALRAGDAPIYVVHFSQDAALASAQALASYGVAEKPQREAVKEACKGTKFNTAFGKTLQRLLSCGVGVHHAGMLPRYRLLVEKLAQQGLLPVICGTDTLGVGINVPIHTVLLTALVKFDGHKMRRLQAREFHQIAGRAGRAGFDTTGAVLVQAPEHEIENARARAKAGDDPKKLRKIKLKKPREGMVSWNKNAFDKVVNSAPETLKPRMKMTHAMVLNLVERGGDVRTHAHALLEASTVSDEEKLRLGQRFEEVLATLMAAGVVECETLEDGTQDYFVTTDLPQDFALDQPLSPFLLASLELLDPESPTYELDVISMAEATIEDPRQVLRAQEKIARAKAVAQMKADGVEYEERMEKLEDVTYPKPLEELLEQAFSMYCEQVPWARDHELSPKSILREMVETGATFKSYISALKIDRCEGALLRYLSDAYRVLDRTIPPSKRTERLWDITAWLGVVVRSVDSSLVDEWASAGTVEDAAAPTDAQAVVADRRGMTVLVRNALFARVRLAAARDAETLGELDAPWGFGIRAWSQALDAYYEVHEEVLTTPDARNTTYFEVNTAAEESDHTWQVRQIFLDENDDRDFRIEATVDLDATQDGGDVVFCSLKAGFIEDFAE